jgi:hypothetical protein
MPTFGRRPAFPRTRRSVTSVARNTTLCVVFGAYDFLRSRQIIDVLHNC